MKRREPTIGQERAVKSAPDPRRAARLARLALVAAAAVPSCHRGETPTMSTTNAPTNDAREATPPVAPPRTVIAEQLPAPSADAAVVYPSEQRVATPPPAPPPGPLGGLIAEARATPPGAEHRHDPIRHPRRPSFAELRVRPNMEDMPAELSLKPTRRGK